jgi:hypothetical protein
MHVLNVFRNGNLGIDKRLKGGKLLAIQSKADSADFNQSVHDREKPRGFGVEGDKAHIGETWLGVIHKPSRSFPGEIPTRKTAVTVDSLGATVQSGGSSWCSTQ